MSPLSNDDPQRNAMEEVLDARRFISIKSIGSLPSESSKQIKLCHTSDSSIYMKIVANIEDIEIALMDSMRNLKFFTRTGDEISVPKLNITS